MTINGTMSRMNSVRSPECLNIKILPENHKICGKNLNLSGTQAYVSSFTYSKDYIFIRDLYSSYLSAQSFLWQQVHEACFSEFKIQYALFILLISLYSNSSAEITIKPQSPYIESKGQLHPDSQQMLEAWGNYVKQLDFILKTYEKSQKSLKKLEIFISTLEETLEHSQRPGKIEKAIRLCESAVEIGNGLLSEAEKTLNDIKTFVNRIHLNSKELESYVNQAKELEIFSGERIVHSLFGNL